jgi:alginate O-acetyltransferase complex protein AlgI
MLFNSLDFLIFFPITIILYYILPHKFRWILLLIASYYFYMVWEPIYVVLIIFSTLINYICSIFIKRSKRDLYKKIFMFTTLLSSLGTLFLFKYFNLFISTFNQLTNNNFDVLYILLPMGISFYTFQTLSYTIDVYRGNRNPEYHIGYFALYVVYFPQLVAGPIERSEKLLPELKNEVKFQSSNLFEGFKRMTWGFFKKVVIADNLAIAVGFVYSDIDNMSGLTLLIATVFFAFQIFADFSGYSDIAIGASKIMGINLMENFKRPYFSTSLKEFWSRWHISLSTWFKDYLYIPLGGSKKGHLRTNINLFIVFLISGLWHGASWMFVFWGAAHGLFLIYERSTINIRTRLWKKINLNGTNFQWILKWIFTMTFVLITWIFFRSETINDAFFIIKKIIEDIYSLNILRSISNSIRATQIGFVTLLTTSFSIIIMEFSHFLEEKYYSNYFIFLESKIKNTIIPLYMLILWIILAGSIFTSGSEFIYFQF